MTRKENRENLKKQMHREFNLNRQKRKSKETEYISGPPNRYREENKCQTQE